MNDTAGADPRAARHLCATEPRPRQGGVVVRDDGGSGHRGNRDGERRPETDRLGVDEPVGLSAQLRTTVIPAVVAITAATRISRRWPEER
ncbi:hypothetical protein [Kutzneria sp. NPDC051319]|uniref:hypothetical protein n=1 Tax=Kutzneria sp. NPDC051319 TaxID=3155047 RepID=UPI0034172332